MSPDRKPIKLAGYGSYPTVQDAVLAALRHHQDYAAQSYNDMIRYPSAAKDLLCHLVADLVSIQASIAARAVPDEEFV